MYFAWLFLISFAFVTAMILIIWGYQHKKQMRHIRVTPRLKTVETIYYRFSSAGTGAWVGSDGSDTIHSFRRGEDRLIFVDTDGSQVSLTDFLSNDNLAPAGGQLSIRPVIAFSETLTGVEIQFGSNKLLIRYIAGSDVNIRNFDGEYLEAGEDYLGDLDDNDNPTSYNTDSGLLTDNSLLPNYFGADGNTNLQVTGDDILATLEIDVFISESRTSTDGVFATLPATDGDATSPNDQVSYDITGGTGMGLFVIDANGGISLASGATLDYDTATSYTLEITATDGGTPAMTSDVKTITIGLIENGEAVYSISRTGDTLTAEISTPDPEGVDTASVRYQWFTSNDGGTTKTPITGIADTTSANSTYGVTVTDDDNAGNEDETVDAILIDLIKGTSGDDTALAGTSADDYIYGDAGADIITSGGGADHILGGTGDDTITLSSAAGSVETIYYRFSSAGTGAWTGSDGTDTITNFRRGEDRLIFVDTDGSPIDLATFIDHNNLAIRTLDDSTLQNLIGVEILFGTSKVLEIQYHSSSHVQVYRNNGGAWILGPAERYLGDIPGDAVGDANPIGYNLTTSDVATTSLLPNYFNDDDSQDNLQVTDGEMNVILDLI